ncbi:MAG: radical SAM/SPASM domain-containing protein [Candidatus Thorarchaeota archaeon]
MNLTRIGRNLSFLASVLRMQLITERPIFLSHMITSVCNCRCATCDYWKLGKLREMTTQEIFQMLEEARQLGMTDYVVWGGEPLLRTDLSKILSHANNLGMDCTVITNGWLLPQQIRGIADDLWGVMVSIDHPEAEVHDRLRGISGVYNRAIEGVKLAREFEDLRVLINCVIQKENVRRIDEMVALAQDLDVQLTLEMMEVIEGYNEHLLPSREEIERASRRLIQMKRAGLPISNSVSYFKSLAAQTPYSCQVPKVLVTVCWDGEVRVCSTISESARPVPADFRLGNVTQLGLGKIFRSEAYEMYMHSARECCKCDTSYPREIALIDRRDREAVWNLLTSIL